MLRAGPAVHFLWLDSFMTKRHGRSVEPRLEQGVVRQADEQSPSCISYLPPMTGASAMCFQIPLVAADSAMGERDGAHAREACGLVMRVGRRVTSAAPARFARLPAGTSAHLRAAVYAAKVDPGEQRIDGHSLSPRPPKAIMDALR
jgi:hypothetical protein